jgi:hypothetical protein
VVEAQVGRSRSVGRSLVTPLALLTTLLVTACTAPGLGGDLLSETLSAPPATPTDVDPVEGPVSGAGFCEPAAQWYVEAFASEALPDLDVVDLAGPAPAELVGELVAEFRLAAELAEQAAAAAGDEGTADVLLRFASAAGALARELEQVRLTLEDLLLLLGEPSVGSTAAALASVVYSPEIERVFELIERECAAELASAGIMGF